MSLISYHHHILLLLILLSPFLNWRLDLISLWMTWLLSRCFMRHWWYNLLLLILRDRGRCWILSLWMRMWEVYILLLSSLLRRFWNKLSWDSSIGLLQILQFLLGLKVCWWLGLLKCLWWWWWNLNLGMLYIWYSPLLINFIINNLLQFLLTCYRYSQLHYCLKLCS